MHEFLERDLAYVIRLDEVVWGSLLLGITLFIHGLGLYQTMRLSSALLARTEHTRFQGYVSMGILIVAAWIIVVTSLVEVVIWAGFFVWKDAQPNVFTAIYNAILNYTTLQAGYLPIRWRLLEGLLGMAGLMTAAWSTGIWFNVAQPVLQGSLARERERHRLRAAGHERDRLP